MIDSYVGWIVDGIVRDQPLMRLFLRRKYVLCDAMPKAIQGCSSGRDYYCRGRGWSSVEVFVLEQNTIACLAGHVNVFSAKGSGLHSYNEPNCSFKLILVKPSLV